MTRNLIFSIFLFSNLIFAQENPQNHYWGAHFLYQNSDWLRKDNPSYYNYFNEEIGAQINYYKPINLFNLNPEKSQFLLNGDVSFIQSWYEFPAENNKEKVQRIEFSGGLIYERNLFKNFKIQAQANLGFGFHNDYHYRLEKPFTFVEKLLFGMKYQSSKNLAFHSQLGWQHVSNFNIYPVNKGLDLIVLTFGVNYNFNQTKEK